MLGAHDGVHIYLHEVMDRWFERDVVPRMKGRVSLVRYADDLVLMFEREDDAQRVMAVLAKRFAKYGLTLHPEKTRLVAFQPPPSARPNVGGGGESGTFDLLGFTHYWSRSRTGRWVVKRKTAKSRLKRALRRVAQWCRKVRQWPVSEQAAGLGRKLKGHFAYYGITGNARSLGEFRNQVERVWWKWLNRRSQRRSYTWPEFRQGVQCRFPLPPVCVVHSIYRAAVT